MSDHDSIASRLLKTRQIRLGEPITDEVANIVMAQLLLLESESRDSDVIFHINSTGGNASAALAIRDTMTSLACPVSTVCAGRAVGAPALLAACGAKGKRFAMPHATIQLVPMNRGSGNPADIQAEAREVVRLAKEFPNALAGATGRTVAEIESAMASTETYSAEEAVAFGFIDLIGAPGR